jgi:response regulator RpfG family c-di-GMP phosphodiesterase
MNKEYAGNILIVEDDAELRFILCAHLRAAGFKVHEATDGRTGIELAGGCQPDMIIMDVGLPGMDGIAATRALKGSTQTAAIPVIMLTARSRSEDVVAGLEAGAQEYLFKPFDVAELLARVRTVHRLAIAHKDLDRLNTQLEAEVDAKTRRLQLLYEFMRDLNHADSRDEILDLLVRCVQQTIRVNRISLFLRDAGGAYLVCERAVGVDPSSMPPMPVRHAKGITGQVFHSGKTLAARAIGTSPNGDRDYPCEAFVSTPLMTTSLETPEGVIGVLNVTERENDAPFGDEEIECIRSIADATAIALDNVTRRDRLQQSVRVLLETVGRLAEYRDEETTQHLNRVSKFAKVLATQLHDNSPYAEAVSGRFVEKIVQAAPMHDIGKVGIPDEILTKPGKLTDEEFQIMKTHTDIGRRVLSRALDPAHPVPLLQMCIDIAHCHHERFDGTGYPRRLKGDDIPLSARIIALVDAYDAITSARRYKQAKSHEQAVEIIRGESGTHFDPVIVDAFLACEKKFDEIRIRYGDAELFEPALSAG